MPVRLPVRRPIRYPADGLAALILAGVLPEPRLMWDFARAEGTRRITVTRPGTATRTGNDGTRQTVGANLPRYEYDPRSLACLGLLYEPGATNGLLRSDDVTNASWFKDNTTAPAADSVVENTANSAHAIVQAPTIAGNTLYNTSTELLQSGRRYVQVLADPGDATNYRWATFDLQDGVVTDASSGTTPRILPAPGGYWLCGVTYTSAAVPSNPYVGAFASTSPTGFYPTHVGNGLEAFKVRGFQNEAGPLPTSRIPTAGATVTRNADLIKLDASAFSEIWNILAGSMLVEAVLPVGAVASSFPALLSCNDNTANERINLFVTESTASVGMSINDGGVAQATVNVASAFSAGAILRAAGGWRLNDSIAAVGGVLGTRDTACTIPTCTQMEFGRQQGGLSASAPVLIRRAAYWPYRLPDGVLAEITRAA